LAWKDLEITEMVDLFAPFILDPDSKKHFLSIKEVAGFYELLAEAYEGVLSVRPPDTSKDAEYQKISAAQRPVDYRHDRLARCAALIVEGQCERARAQTPPDEERAGQWNWAYDQLFPDGTRIINASYRAESGNALRVKKLLESQAGEGVAALLKTVIVYAGGKKGEGKETLLDIVQQWITAGTELGALEAKKAARLAAMSSEAPPEQRVIQSARSQWIAVANMVTSALAMSKAPLKDRNAISHPLLSAAEKAAAPPAAPEAAPPAAEDGSSPTGEVAEDGVRPTAEATRTPAAKPKKP
jgi:hypothetical protein